MKKTSLLIAPAVAVATLALTHIVHAQTTNVWQGGSNGSFVWTNTANWTGGVIPNAMDSAAVFTNNVTNNGINWTSTITLGKITNQFGSSAVTIGATAHTGDVLTLSTSSGRPEIFVTNSGRLDMYANVDGASFDKTGAGNLSFRFNPHDMTYVGDIGLNGGTLTVNQDGSLGNTANDVLVRSNATFSISPGGNTGTIIFGSGRDFKTSNGVTFNITTTHATVNATFNGNITGHRVDFIGGSWGLSDATSTKYTLNGTGNNWSNRTTIQMGAKVILGSSSSISTGDLSFQGGNGTWAGLDLGGNTQNVLTLDTPTSTTVARVFVISNGTLNVTNAGGSFGLNGTNGTLVDLSGLTAFSFNGAAANRNFTVTPSTAGDGFANTNEVRLAATGIGSNNISAGAMTIGGGSGASQGNNNRGRLIMGAINEFSAQTLRIGGFNGEGEVVFATTGSLKLRGSNSVAAMPLLAVGDTSAGTRRGTGILDMGTADVLVTDTIIGNMQANSVANLTHTNRVTMGGGTFTSANLYIGTATNPANTGNTLTNVSIFQQDGGTSSVTLLRMGDNRGVSGNNIAFQSSYVIGGTTAVLRATTIDAGTNAIFGANASRTLTISNGGTLRNASGGNLSVSGFDSTTAGRMNINLAGGSFVEADSGQTVTFGANTRLSGAGNLTKTGAGTLILSSGIAGANTGALNISNGTVQLNATGVAAAGTVTSFSVNSGAVLLISQSNQVNNTNATVTLSGGTIQRASGVSEKMGALNLTDNSTIDFVGGTAGTLEFGVYESNGTPSHVLTINNFALGNVLKFGSNLSVTAGISLGFTQGSTFNNSYFSINGMESSAFGGFRAGWDSGTSTFTITSVPEPSTVVAALGLAGLMLWPARRRVGLLIGRK